MQLNQEQQKVVQADKGQYKVEACAGAGKTKCIVERIKKLIFEGNNPNEILFLTFTAEAAKEARKRLERE